MPSDPAAASGPAGAPTPRPGTPGPLRLAAALVVAQGVALVVYAVLEAASISTARVTMGVSTALFFAAYGAVLLFCGWGLLRAYVWARGPAVLAQLIWLGVAWSFRGGGTTWVSVALTVVAAVTLVGLFHPRTTSALVGDEA